MQITTFNPQIITKDAEPIVKLFEEMGFAQRHCQKEIGELDVTAIRMRDENGFNLDISVNDKIPMEAMNCIRMNVDNFEEVYELLLSRGFKNIYGDHYVETPTSKSAVLFAPSGFAINLIEHIKK